MFDVIFTIIGTIIGAGFASGREIFVFFSKYGTNGILGIIITGCIISLIIYKVFIMVKTFEIDNYNKLIEMINWKHKKLNRILNTIIDGFLLVSFYIMVAGFGSYMKQIFNIPTYASCLIFVCVCFFVFKKNINGVIKVNDLIVPFLVFFIIILGIKSIPNILKTVPNVSTRNAQNWFISCLLYTSYNSIILVPVLTGLKGYLKNKKSIILISIFSGLVVIILALLIYFMLLKENYFINQLDMPLLYIAKEFGLIFTFLYGFVIIASIFTTAISAGYSFLKNTANKNNYNKILFLMCITAVLISNIGFSSLLETLYPLFGILGFFQIILILNVKIK